MEKVVRFYRSTIGKKFVVAITGLLLIAFVVGHVVGNLKVFLGYDASGVHHLDMYGHFLRTFLEEAFGPSGFLWLVRIGLIATVALHIGTVLQLRMLNAKAKPQGYRGEATPSSSLAARTMMVGGIILLAFIVFHILHLTTGDLHPHFVEGKVYANVYHAFQVPWVTGFYVIAMVFLGFHLYHGIWSLCQTLGVDNPDLNLTIRTIAKVGSVLVVAGFISVPLAVAFGALPVPHVG